MRKFAFAGLLVIMCVSSASCGNYNDETAVPELMDPVMSVGNTVKVEAGDIDNTDVVTGEIIPYTEELSFSREGFVDEVCVSEGDHVKKGDVLAIMIGGIDNVQKQEIENEIDTRKKDYAVSNLDLEYDIKILQLEKDKLEDDYKKASGRKKKELNREIRIKQADINIARQNLDNQVELQNLELEELERKRKVINDDVDGYYLYSDMDGIVSYVLAHNSDQVGRGTLVVAVSDPGRLHVRSDYVSNKQYNKAKRCYISVDGREYDVKLRPYDVKEADERLQNKLPVYSFYDIEGGTDGLEIGEDVDVHVEMESSRNTLYVPVNAVYTEGGRSYVYKYEDGAKIMTDIETGIENSTYVEVLGDLEEGDDVYVKP